MGEGTKNTSGTHSYLSFFLIVQLKQEAWAAVTQQQKPTHMKKLAESAITITYEPL